jgi:hypothetical protein
MIEAIRVADLNFVHETVTFLLGARLPGEQRLASGRRTVMDEVVECGVVGIWAAS